MRVIALEEHYSVPSLVAKISAEAKTARGFRERVVAPGQKSPLDSLPDLGAERLASMDANGVTVQVISQSAAGADLVDGPDGVALAREFNDTLAAACKKHPTRFKGFAHLPLRSPDACAKELQRAVNELGFVGALVNGTCQDLFLDHARYEPLLAAAEQLDVPIYLHPSLPPASVYKTYYDGLPGSAGVAISTAGWGWHSETAIHTLRLVLSGALDKHPKLKIIIGHMGEGLPAMLHRLDDVSAAHIRHLKRPISRTILDQVWLTTSGMFTYPPLLLAMQVFGLDRIMFSIDYPYAHNEQGSAYLKELAQLMAPHDLEALAHGNADRLLKLKA